jgi:hypothetical protein
MRSGKSLNSDSQEVPLVAIAAKGPLLPISCGQEEYHANLVALPVEREEEFLSLLGQK